jgi:CxxC motif-containing protein (DUF1111 family)
VYRFTVVAIACFLLSEAAKAENPVLGLGSPLSGAPIAGLTAFESAAFQKGLAVFTEVDGVANGLGPRFNLDSCAGCHARPAAGGSSPSVNPQFAMATKAGALNHIPPFLQPNGPVREVRVRSAGGGVRDLFVITGRNDAPLGCRIMQGDFSSLQDLAFRIPTPTFGLGLVEAISDSTLRANLAANSSRKQQLGITGRFNTSGNDGTITRFGWKAQNKSLTIFSGEAYNVEMGVTNDVFPQEREEDANCATNPLVESTTNLITGELSDVDQFTLFMRFLAPPPPQPLNQTTSRGQQVFDAIGCTMCHTPQLRTGKNVSAALSQKPVNLYSDLALHNMGQGLADGISQGAAQVDEFRTAPLWGLGDRLFFLHDGRSQDLTSAIQQHDSQGSEASQTVHNFTALSRDDKQTLLSFLQSL